MSNLLLLQQQLTASLAPPRRDPWQFWSSSTIAGVTGCPEGNVAAGWPAIYDALDARGIATQSVCGGVIATIAIETASTFKPVTEAFWLDDDWRRANLRYYPWYGRGYIQLTWESNYRTYGPLVGVDLISNPEQAMEPETAAKVLAEFFVQSRVAEAAEANDWVTCRKRVQGGDDGLDRLKAIVSALGLPG